jgi:hypothetical protein
MLNAVQKKVVTDEDYKKVVEAKIAAVNGLGLPHGKMLCLLDSLLQVNQLVTHAY